MAADPLGVQVLELALDTPDFARVKPFWRAVLGLSDSRDEREIVDTAGILPTLWFQDTDPHDEPRQRFHLDIRVPPEVARERIAAALAAGGVLVSDEGRPRSRCSPTARGTRPASPPARVVTERGMSVS